MTSAEPLAATVRCMTDRIESKLAAIYPDPVQVKAVSAEAEASAASFAIFRVRRAKSVLHWEDDPLWVFDFQATANGTAVQVFEARDNPFYADSRESRIKETVEPCVTGQTSASAAP